MKQQGFTLIELVTSIVVGLVFIIVIYQIQMISTTLSVAQARYSKASSIAYANLRKYANDLQPKWFTCIYSGTPSAPQNVSLSPNPANAPIDGLPSPTTQTIIASAPYGCGGSATSGYPIRVESTVTYGSDNRSVTHVSYVAF